MKKYLHFLRLPKVLAWAAAVAGLAAPGGARAQACTGVDPAGRPAVSGLYATYFSGYFNDDPSFFTGKAPGLARIDSQLNFADTGSWGAISPPATDVQGNPDAFSARFQGALLIATGGTYTLTLTSDDASFLWLDAAARRATPVNAEATVDNGLTHGTTAISATVVLATGRHDLLVHYGDRARFNVLTLEYSGPDTGNRPVVVPAAALCTGTDDPALAALDVQVFPNPVAPNRPVRLHVRQGTAAPVHVVVSDVLGRTVYLQAFDAATALDVPLPALTAAGIYLFRVTSDLGTYTQKLAVD